MRTRKNRIVFCLDDKEFEKLKKKVKKSGMSMSAFLRKLCDEKEIKDYNADQIKSAKKNARLETSSKKWRMRYLRAQVLILLKKYLN